MFDFIFHVRTARVPTLGEAAIWSAVYIGIAVMFGVAIMVVAGRDAGEQYFAGLPRCLSRRLRHCGCAPFRRWRDVAA
ncbi:MAG TPA: hypothetical protein VLZ05_05185 [Mycobacterium sp.]|nr:hypothetical protein [Mycobacterium sp.]HUH68313.1 hypothetical protein [Mycobacterium sp.]